VRGICGGFPEEAAALNVVSARLSSTVAIIFFFIRLSLLLRMLPGAQKMQGADDPLT
jgi:hypothetical protein